LNVKILQAKPDQIAKSDFTVMVGSFNTPLSDMDRPSRQKISKDTVELNNTIHQLDVTDIIDHSIQQE
jgi:hypothetical protein